MKIKRGLFIVLFTSFVWLYLVSQLLCCLKVLNISVLSLERLHDFTYVKDSKIIYKLIFTKQFGIIKYLFMKSLVVMCEESWDSWF